MERYPEFVPWVTRMRTWNRRPGGEGITLLDAEAQVGFSVVNERFGTRVVLDEPARIIKVELLSGPFRRLTSQWTFEEHATGVKLTFDIDFEFKSRLLAALLSANFGRAVNRLIACFEGRAKALYG